MTFAKRKGVDITRSIMILLAVILLCAICLVPGEAKGELKKRIEREGLGGRIVGVETVDKMRDGQIAAKVRQYFLNLK